MRPERNRESVTDIASIFAERRAETTIVLHPQEKVSIDARIVGFGFSVKSYNQMECDRIRFQVYDLLNVIYQFVLPSNQKKVFGMDPPKLKPDQTCFIRMGITAISLNVYLIFLLFMRVLWTVSPKVNSITSALFSQRFLVSLILIALQLEDKICMLYDFDRFWNVLTSFFEQRQSLLVKNLMKF